MEKLLMVGLHGLSISRIFNSKNGYQFMTYVYQSASSLLECGNQVYKYIKTNESTFYENI